MAIEQKFYADPSAVLAAIAKIEAKTQSLENAQKQSSARSKAASQEQIEAVKRWQAANDQAMAAGIASIKRREQATFKLTASEIRASEEAAAKKRQADQAANQVAQKFDQERIAHRQQLLARLTAMENEHASRSSQNWKMSSGRASFASGQTDAGVAANQERIRAAIKLSEIRKSEMAAANARKADTDALNENANAVDALAMKVVGLGVAYKAVSSAVTGVITKNEEFLSKLDAMGQIRADEELKLQIQGGLLPKEIEQRMPQLEKFVLKTPSVGGATPQEMFANTVQLASQLASSNVKDPEALGAVLQLKAGTNRFGRGVGGEAADVRSLVQFLKGTGNLEPTAKDILKTGGGISEVFEASDLQFSDLSHLSPHASTLKALGMDEMQQLAAFANLTDVQGSELSGRGLKIMGLRLSTANETEASGKALETMGLKPEDIAIAEGGKSMTQSMKLLRDKLAPLDKEKQNRLLEDIFGGEGIGIAQTMLAPGRLEQIEAWTEKARKAEGFQSKVKAFEGSRFARDRANIAATGFSQRRHDIQTGEFTWRELENEKELIRSRDLEGRSVGTRAFLNFGSYVEDTANWMFNKARGATPEEAGYENPNATKQNELLERIAVGVERERPRERNRNGNVENVGAN